MPNNAAPYAGPRCARSICSSGLQVLAYLLVTKSISLKFTPFRAHVRLGNATTTQGCIETNAQDLLSRAQPRVQIVYDQPFPSATLLLIFFLSFAPLDIAHHKSGAGIQALYDHYSIPSDFISQRLESVTHSFSAVYDGSSYCMLNHCSCSPLMMSTSFLVSFPL